MAVSVFDLFKVGIGPSSSHTVGPMRAARLFARSLAHEGLLAATRRVRCEFFGSLGATGRGHGSDKAVLLGLCGHEPDRIEVDRIDALLAGSATEVAQDESQATYFGGRKPEDGRVQWTQTSRQIFNLIRAVTDPYPGAFTDVNGSRLMLWWAETDSPATRDRRGRPGEVLSVSPLVIATGDGALELTRTEWRGVPVLLQPGQLLVSP